MLRIGELAALTGVTSKTIRHYHRIGLLPEAKRTANGYRSYGLEDAVRLLRIRRMAGLGMSLDEVADALSERPGEDLREILAELDADLLEQETRIRNRRRAIAALLARSDDLRVPSEVAPLAAQLGAVFGGDEPSLDRERLVLELLGPLTGEPEAMVEAYQRVLDDPQTSEQFAELSRRFDALAQVGEDDPAVDSLVADGTAMGGVVAALLPEQLRESPGDPPAARTLLKAMTADMTPAQTRCLTLLFAAWQEQSS